MGGATGPVTLAGLLVLSLAEFLAGMVVSQLTRRGAPLIMGGVISSMDMHTTILTYGSPELHLLSAAMTDVAHWLKVPMFSTAGCSDSKTLDEQAALEAALSIMAAGLSGANLIHDVGFTIGVLSILGVPFNLTIIAAILTIIGYSLNDTIVVFDRIRENLNLYRRERYEAIVNMSINQTLSRTLLTSVTTLTAVLALLIFGGGVIRNFAIALMVGVFVGTYSSIFIASPFVVFMHKRAEKKRHVTSAAMATSKS